MTSHTTNLNLTTTVRPSMQSRACWCRKNAYVRAPSGLCFENSILTLEIRNAIRGGVEFSLELLHRVLWLQKQCYGEHFTIGEILQSKRMQDVTKCIATVMKKSLTVTQHIILPYPHRTRPLKHWHLKS